MLANDYKDKSEIRDMTPTLIWHNSGLKGINPDLSYIPLKGASVSVEFLYAQELKQLRHLLWLCYEIIPELVDACPNVDTNLLAVELRGELSGHILPRAELFYPGR